MTTTYKVCWQKKSEPLRKGEGRGGLTLAEADSWVRAMNAKYPGLHHWSEPD